jgi:hypothetical protein
VASSPIPPAVKPAPAAPKKETSRLQVPKGPQPKMPQATVKLQHAAQPAPAPAAQITTVAAAPAAEADGIAGILSWAVLGLSLLSAIMSYLAFAAAG